MNSDEQGEKAGRPDGSASLDELIDRAARGDMAAFLAFYDQTSPIIYRYAVAVRHGDRVAAESLTRVIYLEAWRTADQYASSGLSAVAWLIAAGHNSPVQTTTITEHAC